MTQTFSPANILKKSRVYNWQLWKKWWRNICDNHYTSLYR